MCLFTHGSSSGDGAKSAAQGDGFHHCKLLRLMKSRQHKLQRQRQQQQQQQQQEQQQQQQEQQQQQQPPPGVVCQVRLSMASFSTSFVSSAVGNFGSSHLASINDTMPAAAVSAALAASSSSTDDDNYSSTGIDEFIPYGSTASFCLPSQRQRDWAVMEHLQDKGEPRHIQQTVMSQHQPPAASAVDSLTLPAGIHSSSLAADSALVRILDWDDQDLVNLAVDEANSTSLLADQGRGAAAGFVSQHCRPNADGRCRFAEGGKVATAKVLRSNLTLEQLAPLQLSHPTLSSYLYKGSLNGDDVDILVIQHKAGCGAKVAAEVQKMQGLAHANVVSSRHFVTWSSPCAASEAATTGHSTEPLLGQQQQYIPVLRGCLGHLASLAADEAWQNPRGGESAEGLEPALAQYRRGVSSGIQQWSVDPSRHPCHSTDDLVGVMKATQLPDAGKLQMGSAYNSLSNSSLPSCGNVLRHVSSELYASAVGPEEPAAVFAAAPAAAMGGGWTLALDGTGSSPDGAISGTMETWVVQERGSFGTLRDVLDGKGGCCSVTHEDIPQMEVILKVLLGVGRGMAYLHSQNVVHGNLTASSVVMTGQPAGQCCSTSCSSVPLTDLNTPSASGSRRSGVDLRRDKSASCSSGNLSRRLCTSSCKCFQRALSGLIRDLGLVISDQTAVVADDSKGSYQRGALCSDLPSNSSAGVAGAVDDCCATAGCPMAAALVPKVAMSGLPGLLLAGGSSAAHLCPAVLGPLSHQSPEMMRTGQPSRPADVFSFGVVMWEAITGQVPWEGKLPGELILAVMVEEGHLAFGPCVPKDYVSLAQSCMLKDPVARPSFAEVVTSLSQLLEQSQQLQQQAKAAWGKVSGHFNADIV